MTDITFFKSGERITRMICEGHTGFGESGEDIVCSALSSIVQTGALGMLMVVGANVEVVRDDKRAYLELVVPQNLDPNKAHDVQVIFATMLCGVSDLYSEYSDYINLEVRDVY